MTAFEDAARAEAESRYIDAAGPREHNIAMSSAGGGFLAGAAWARRYEAEREPSEAEVEAGARAIWATRYPESRPDIAESTWAEMTAPDDWMPEAIDILGEARAARTAFRKAGMEGEG